ncbi:DegT/DnrJ/EryC1/StrS family aminotransferase [candidate division WOR-3 bacterium]|nr:DegT/DnrJ/EryC1/StrS family aminotransferase [candidate division WOR-3 bacterium]
MISKIPVAEPVIGEKEFKYVNDALKSCWVSYGKYIDEFEAKFASYCGAKHGIAVTNGTVALHLALVSLNIGEKDEVILPTLTFASTCEAVLYTHAKPVFCDSEKDTWCIDPTKIEKKINPNTKVIIPVHLYGHPANMKPILEIAKKYNLYVIEDACEAHGAEIQMSEVRSQKQGNKKSWKKVGSFGDIGVFSFYGNKIITTGQGGMLITDNKKIADRARLLYQHAMDPQKRYWHLELGYNYQFTNLQAALGVAQLEQIDYFIKRKREIAELYTSLFKDIPGITTPKEKHWAKSVFWIYSILIEPEFGITRDKLAIKLKEHGIETRPVFYPLHQMPPYLPRRLRPASLVGAGQAGKTGEHFPVAEEISKKGLSLPSSVKLKKSDIKKVVNAIITRVQGIKKSS